MNILPNFNMIGTNRVNAGGGGGGGFTNTYSLALDGVDDYVDCGDVTTLDNVTSATWSIWANSSITTSYHYLMSCYSTGFKQYLFKQSTNKIDIFLADSSGTLRLMNTSNFTFTVGVWFHIAMVYDETEVSDADKLKVYIDGVLQTNTVSGFALTSLYTSKGNSTEIGKAGGYTTNEFFGNLDEVAIFTTAKTQLEITDIYNLGTPTDLSALAGLTNWYRNGDNGTWKSPQWLIPNNENKTKFSNYSFEYDGIDDYVDCGAITQINSASALTFSFWGKKPISTEKLVVGSSITGTNGIWLSWWSDGNVYFSPRNGAYSNASFALAHDTNWHHFAGVYDGSIITADRCILYVDGVKVANSLSGVPTSLSATAGNNFQIGALLGTYFTSANIDEVAVWNSALTSSDITTIYNSGTPNDLSSLSPVGYWRSEQSYFTDNWLVDNSALSNYSTRSFAFDGVDDEINCGDVLHNDGQTPMTLSAWVNISTPASHTRIYTIAGKKRKRNAPLYAMRGWDIGFITSGTQQNRLQFRIVGVDSGGSTIGTIQKKGLGTVFVDGLWHHVVVTYDGSESASGVKFYVDGVEDTLTQTLIDSLSGNSVNDPTVDFKIATAPRYGGNDFYNGNIDELAIWSTTALTQEQVTTLYNGGEPARIDGATAHWRMGEDATFNTNWNVPDNVGSATGTSANMTISDLEGNAPNYTGGGLSNNMTIEDRVGDASNSTSNALSLNMDEVDRETDVP